MPLAAASAAVTRAAEVPGRPRPRLRQRCCCQHHRPRYGPTIDAGLQPILGPVVTRPVVRAPMAPATLEIGAEATWLRVGLTTLSPIESSISQTLTKTTATNRCATKNDAGSGSPSARPPSVDATSRPVRASGSRVPDRRPTATRRRARRPSPRGSPRSRRGPRCGPADRTRCRPTAGAQAPASPARAPRRRSLPGRRPRLRRSRAPSGGDQLPRPSSIACV